MRWLARLGALALIVAVVLGYGYWRAWSRANISMIVSDTSSGPNSVPAFVAELTLRDAAGRSLAKGRSSARFGSVSFSHPQHGSCESEEVSAATSTEARGQWDRCIGEKFRWQAGWVKQVNSLEIQFAQCRVADIPLTLRQGRADWWLWWVPLPHIGGDPLTDYSAKILVDSVSCQARATGFYE